MVKRVKKKRKSKIKKAATKTTGSVEKSVMEKIEKGEVKMMSKNYFLFRSLFAKLILILFSFIAVFATSYVFYKLRNEHSASFMFLGNYGLVTFIRIFPWIGIILAFVSILVLLYLTNSYGKIYRTQKSVINLATICTIIVIGIVLDFAGLNKRLAKTKVFGKYYEIQYVTENSVQGKVVGLEENGLILITPKGRRIQTLVKKGNSLEQSRYKIGEKVTVAGYWEGSTFVAVGVGK